MSGVEYSVPYYGAYARAGACPFPDSWGTPPDTIPELRAWIRRHAEAEAPASYRRQLTRHDIQLRNLLRQHEIEQRR